MNSGGRPARSHRSISSSSGRRAICGVPMIPRLDGDARHRRPRGGGDGVCRRCCPYDMSAQACDPREKRLRRRAAPLLLLLAGSLVGAPGIADAQVPDEGVKTIYVDQTDARAEDDNPGTDASPLLTLSRAISLAA